MTITVSTKRDYIPKWNGNDKLTAQDQIKVEHKAPTLALKEKLFPKVFQYDAAGDIKGEFEIDRVKILKEFIIEIKNLHYKLADEKDVVARIRTSEDLFKAPPELDGLVDELYSYFQELLNTRINEKN